MVFKLDSRLTLEERLAKAVVAIMNEAPAIAGVLMIGERHIIDDNYKGRNASCNTACTDGRNEWYNREYCDKLSDRQLRFVLIHEVYHKMYRHLITWQHLNKIDPKRANMAMDLHINPKILDEFGDFVEFNDAWLLNRKYDSTWDTARIFWDLRGNGGGSGGDENDGGNGGKPVDDHDWEGAADMPEEEQKELEREIDETLRQGDTVAGKGAGNTNIDLDELMKAQVKWEEALSEFMVSTCTGTDLSTFRRPKRRFLGEGIYMPSLYSEAVGELIFASDTSGSVVSCQSYFLSEIRRILETVNPEKVRLLYWDDVVQKEEIYEPDAYDRLVNSTSPRGGGGTDVNCVSDYIAENKVEAQAAVIFTDGYFHNGWGNWHLPTLWCVLDSGLTAPVGKTVHINSSELRRW